MEVLYYRRNILRNIVVSDSDGAAMHLINTSYLLLLVLVTH